MTVRRDLDALDDAGLVVKVHGGATLRYQHSSDEPGFEAKSLRNTAEKRAIAASAAVLVGVRARRSASRPARPPCNSPPSSSAPRPHRRDQQHQGGRRPPRRRSARSHGDPRRGPAHAERRARRTGRACRRSGGSTSTPSSWACTACTRELVSRRRTCSRRRPTRAFVEATERAGRARRPHEVGRRRPLHDRRRSRGRPVVVSDDRRSMPTPAPILTERVGRLDRRRSTPTVTVTSRSA